MARSAVDCNCLAGAKASALDVEVGHAPAILSDHDPRAKADPVVEIDHVVVHHSDTAR
jgi:hypothetical protein